MTPLRPLLALLLLLPAAFAAIPSADAAPSCGTPDEHLNLVDTDVWYGGGGCYGASNRLDNFACLIFPIGVDRPYAVARTWICRTDVVVQP